MEKLFGVSWRTTIWGTITSIAAFITLNPDLVSAVLPETTAKTVFSIAALISGIITFTKTRDNKVSSEDVGIK